MSIALRLPSTASPSDVSNAQTAILAAVGTPAQALALTAAVASILSEVDTRATSSDADAAATATVTAIQVSLTAIAQQITDLAAAGVDSSYGGRIG